MNNEPVAWMSEFGQFIGKVQDEICHIPLYTHPVKELTDEEWNKWVSLNMDKFYFKVGKDLRFNGHGFADAVLRKAQKK